MRHSTPSLDEKIADVVTSISVAQQEDDGRGQEVHNDMHVLDGSVVLIPKLILTVPTPELDYSAELTPGGLVNDGSDHQDNVMLAANMATPAAPNELEFVTHLIDARSSKDLDTGPELLVDPLCKGRRRRSYLRKKVDSILNGRFGLFPRTGDADPLGDDAPGSSGEETEMGTSGNGFRWLTSHRKMDIETTRMKDENAGRVWKKRLSRILEKSSSSGRRTGGSGSGRPHGSHTTGEMANTTTRIRPASPLSSSGDHLRSGRSLSESHCSGSSLLETTTRVNEEGEHAASRLFGTPDTGMRTQHLGTGTAEPQERPGLTEPRRHSFGFGLKSLRFSGRR